MDIHINSRVSRSFEIQKIKQNLTDYVHVKLTEIYQDTSVSDLWFSKGCISEVDDWVTANLAGEQKEIVEIGGIFLGNHLMQTGSYQLIIEQFLPINQVERQSRISLTIGKGMAYAYAEVMDEFPNMGILAWFHTHPGHGPFLSNTDLDRTHNVFFREPYQIAIVLDSLTNEYITGIFSRKKNTQMNNAQDAAKWIPWKALLENFSN